MSDRAADPAQTSNTASRTRGQAKPASRVSRQVTVATGTPEYDGDYSYDVAHDIRGR
ncbi:MAG TPA: hypothetical protein VGJ44_22435 [Kribbellaceae bacterium]